MYLTAVSAGAAEEQLADIGRTVMHPLPLESGRRGHRHHKVAPRFTHKQPPDGEIIRGSVSFRMEMRKTPLA